MAAAPKWIDSHSSLVLKLRRTSTKRSYHGRQRSTSIDSACRATPVVAPQLPHSADPGTITGWIVDETAAATTAVITQELERGFNRLVDNIPDANHADHAVRIIE
jgi:hypothetical protein